MENFVRVPAFHHKGIQEYFEFVCLEVKKASSVSRSYAAWRTMEKHRPPPPDIENKTNIDFTRISWCLELNFVSL